MNTIQIFQRYWRVLLSFGNLFFVVTQAWALNPIQLENAIPPVAEDYQWTWSAAPGEPHTIEGYADKVSVNLGETIKFYVNTNPALNATYQLTIYRLGYYSGAGARRMQAPVTLTSVAQPLPTPDPVTGLIECHWTESHSLTIPTSGWISGVYIATLVGTTTGEGTYISFVVTEDASSAMYVFQTSDTTWQAYNNWGGKSLYTFNSTNNIAAVKVSYNRPYVEGRGMGQLTNWELQALRFLEKNGYDVTYQSNVDTHVKGVAQLIKHKAYLSIGHDEYWSKPMRDAVESARNQGVSLAFLGANIAYWQIRFENSLNPNAANRTIVSYKNNGVDPIADPALKTIRWRDLTPPKPENALLGVMYTYDPVDSDIVISKAEHWVFTGTGLQNGSHLTGLLGYEVDTYFNNNQAPVNLEILANSPVPGVPGVYSNMSIYSKACLTSCVNPTATVFATGSIQWAWGLDSFWTVNRESTAAKQITHNVLARLVNANATLPALPPNSVNNIAPSFVGGATNLTVTQNTVLDIKPNLHVSDPDTGQMETWTQTIAPTHGVLNFNNATASSGSNDITPGGTISYQPNAGYVGSDSFSIQVSDGSASAMRHFTVMVNGTNDPNLLINPSLETDANNDALPDCWQYSGYGNNTYQWSRTTTAHSGNFGQQLQITNLTSGDRKLLLNLDSAQNAGSCAPLIQAGASYRLSVYYQTTAPVNIVVFYLNASNVWTYWTSSPQFAANSIWTQAVFNTPPVPASAKALSFGLALNKVGTLITDDYALVQSAVTNTTPTFVGGTTLLNVLQNSSAVDLKPNLHVSDTDIGQTETWTQAIAPAHGVLSFNNATASSGSNDITPGGTISYQPNPGYTGTDSFSIQVNDGTASGLRSFTVTVNPTTGANLLLNPSLELDTNNDALPDCWQYSGYGNNTYQWSRTNTAYSGNFGQQLQITNLTSGDRKLLIKLDGGQNAGGCAPLVQAGASYRLSVYYQTTAPVNIVVFYLNASNIWTYWTSSPRFAANSTWTQAVFNTPPVPASAKALSFGLALDRVGTLITDDYSLVQL